MLLLRHASAGERLSSPEIDRFRRLDDAGRVVARQLVWSLADREITRIVSSPLARCVESVVPIAESRRARRRDPLGARAGRPARRSPHASRRSARHDARVHAPRGLREAARLGRDVREGRHVGARAERRRARARALPRAAGRGGQRRSSRASQRLSRPAPFPGPAQLGHTSTCRPALPSVVDTTTRGGSDADRVPQRARTRAP